MTADIKVALVHDYLQDYGDAERVLQVIHRIYPHAPLYTAFVDYEALGTDFKRFDSWDIRTTWAQRIPRISDYHPSLRGLIPYFWETLDLSEFDLVISSSGSYLSKSVLTRSETLHVSYCHTPPRHLWEYARSRPYPAYRQWYETWTDTRLRQYDFYSAQRVDRYIAPSPTVARRINKFYSRTAEVISPPVQVRGEGKAGDQYYLCISPLVRSRQVDLAVSACTQLGQPLWVVGKGSEMPRLQSMAGPTVRFLGEMPDEAMASLYADAKALIFPSESADFGREAVEAMGHGVPVIACQRSGLRDVVLDFRTGVLFQEATVENLCDAIAQFEGLRFSAIACIERAEEFAESVFVSKLEWFIAQALDTHRIGETMLKH